MDRVSAEIDTNGRRSGRTGQRVGLGACLAYGIGGGIGGLVIGNTVMLLSTFYNGLLGVPATLVGVAIVLPRFWDAVSDPLVGQWSDRFHSKWGRRRPFMIVGAIGIGVTFSLFWLPPFEVGDTTALSIWVLVTGLLLYTFYTVFQIPYEALGFELSLDYDERTRVQGWRAAMGQIIEMVRLYMLALGLLIIAGTRFAGNERAGYGVGGMVFAVAALGIGLIPALFLRERFGSRRAAGLHFFRAFWTTLKRKVYLQLIVFQVLFVMGLFFVATTMTYFLQYYVGRPSFLGHSQVVSGLCIIAWVFIWSFITPRIGKVRVLRIGTFMLAAAGLSTWFAYTPDNPYRAFIFPLMWGPGWAAYQVMLPAIVADITDLDELETGERREGSYASIMGFVMKLAATGVGIPIGLVLDYWVKFEAGQGPNQPPEVWYRMKLCTAVITCAFSLLALLTLIKFPLTKQRMLEVRALLDARKRDEASAGA